MDGYTRKNFKDGGINSIVFYTETLRLLKHHLHVHAFKNSQASLWCFVDSHTKNTDSVEETPIHTETPLKEIEDIVEHHTVDKDHRIQFLEDFRILILTTIKQVDRRSRHVLSEYHILFHLIQLSLESNKSEYQKINEFLNSNFALDSKDVVQHACRGNYGAIVEICPGLGTAIEELHEIGSSKSLLKEWKKRYSISDLMFKIFIGEYKDFENILEEYCYCCLHGIEFSKNCIISSIFRGQLNYFEERSPGLVKLAFLITHRWGCVADYERCFEELFHEAFKLDHITGLEFLSFSRKCSFYFDYLIELTPLNCITIEILLGFAAKNELRNEKLLKKFACQLLDQKEYDSLCRFLLSHFGVNVKYTKDFLQYFIRNFDGLKFSVSKEASNDPVIRFVANVSDIGTVVVSELVYVLRSEYFPFVIEDVVEAIATRADLGEKVVIETIDKLLEIENTTGISMKNYKTRLLQILMK